MMLEFHRTMDNHAREVWRVTRPTNGIDRTHWAIDCGAMLLGHVMWHAGNEPHFTPLIAGSVTLKELDAIARELHSHVDKPANA